jgi:uncharacterized protein
MLAARRQAIAMRHRVMLVDPTPAVAVRAVEAAAVEPEVVVGVGAGAAGGAVAEEVEEDVVAKRVVEPLPNLGVGLGYRSAFGSDLFTHRDSIDFLEVIADHYYDASPPRQAELTLLEHNFPLVPHGLTLSLGSAEGMDEVVLKHFARLVNAIDPPWCSDHIAFTRAGGIDMGHLTPLPKTRASLSVLHDNICRVQEVVRAPLILENITESLRFPDESYSDADFLCEVCSQNDVGLLLDVTNLYINSVNHGLDALDVLHRLPADRIVQLHFVGGHIEDGVWVDSHSSETPEEIWSLLEEVVKVAPVKGILLERDERIPPVAELVVELDRARSILRASQPSEWT